MFRSATFKLTLYYLAIVVVISLIFSAVVYRVGTDDLAFGLHHQTQRITQDFPVFDDSPYLRSESDLATGNHRLLGRLVAFNVVVIIVAGFASYALARRTLIPIEEAHEQQKRFTADVSHELRTPLTALKMEAEVALLDPSATKTSLRKVLASNLEETAKLDNLINNLLRLSRLEAGELQQNFKLIKVPLLLTEAVRQVQTIAEARQISLVVDDAPPLTVSGDSDSLVQVLVILLDNAIKYSPRGSTIRLGATTENGRVLLSVADKGVGIERQALDHVFDRFYRADPSRNQNQQPGSGLGLSIAKLIADLHNASITLSSRPQHGTTATLSLPAYSLR